ncbi:hypothetical protein BDV93DRAFT_300205 [Ceratobasidium sp. AG-I]|nr:hypothetical protein BDV93DRAFT_300205 [Ceratobasidium sp. AG-I]
MQPLHMPAPSLKKSSCLTCRQRRKKCDKVRPVCQSCITSGFSCSWYDKDEREAGGASSESQGRPGLVPERQESGRSKHKPILPRPAVESVSYTRQQPRPQDLTQAEVPLRPSLAQMCPTSARPARPVYEPEFGGSISGAPEAVPTPGYYNTTFTDSADSSFDDLWPQNQSQSLTRSRTPLQPSSVRRDTTNRTSLETTSIINELGLVMNVLCKNIPRSVNVNVSIRASYFSYVLSQ